MCTRKVESTGLPYFNRYFLSSLIFGLDFENVDGSGHANAKKSTFQFFFDTKKIQSFTVIFGTYLAFS
jgi:hypothetical protein